MTEESIVRARTQMRPLRGGRLAAREKRAPPRTRRRRASDA